MCPLSGDCGGERAGELVTCVYAASSSPAPLCCMLCCEDLAGRWPQRYIERFRALLNLKMPCKRGTASVLCLALCL
jgi:hypothetical protein